MLIVNILEKKRNGLELNSDEIDFFIQSLIRNEASEAQAAAFLMASFINGLTENETFYLTRSMAEYGAKLNIDKNNKYFIDKHSTGGVGDKISLILLPIATSLGIGVPMISGRGLAHTGGTLDKLESIKGFNVNINDELLLEAMNSFGGFFIGQSSSIAPADKILYKIRDVTATVDSPGLITASILSKKLAENLDGLVLDMKVGKGAFMKSIEEAKSLAGLMKRTAEKLGLKMKVVLTNMDEPLGNAIGNYNEILEVIECLKGNFPSDLKNVTYRLTAEMLIMANKCNDLNEAFLKIDEAIKSKQALEIFHQIVKFQGGDLAYNYTKDDYYIVSLLASDDSYIKSIDSLKLGNICIEIKAGRKKETDTLDHFTGINLFAKKGDFVEKNQLLAEIIIHKETKIKTIQEKLLACYSFAAEKPFIKDEIIEVI